MLSPLTVVFGIGGVIAICLIGPVVEDDRAGESIDIEQASVSEQANAVQQANPTSDAGRSC